MIPGSQVGHEYETDDKNNVKEDCVLGERLGRTPELMIPGYLLVVSDSSLPSTL
jgi:hypothetical protein